MSYKSDMEFFHKQYNQRKRTARMILKITLYLLAAAVLIGAVGGAVTLIVGSADREPPVITGPDGDTVTVYIGDTIAYRSFVECSDNSGEEVELKINTKNVNPDAEGTYQVAYRAVDAADNVTDYVLMLVVKKRNETEDALMQKIEQKVKELGLDRSGITKVEQVKKIYNYVNNLITWDDGTSGLGDSNIMKTHGAAFTRDTWKTDWVEEATLTLQNKGGDCYSYYSLSKAFFEYLGIENLGIRRSEKSTEQGTHFWNVVNVGTEAAPRWYYYDATELAGSFSDGTDNGCLMTEDKLNSYRTSKGVKDQFYLFDKWNGFPSISTEKVS